MATDTPLDAAAARQLILSTLGRIAPEVDPDTIDGAAELQVELDLDSMDFLNLVEGVSHAVDRDIPERDYPQLVTLDSFVEYLVSATREA